MLAFHDELVCSCLEVEGERVGKLSDKVVEEGEVGWRLKLAVFDSKYMVLEELPVASKGSEEEDEDDEEEEEEEEEDDDEDDNGKWADDDR